MRARVPGLENTDTDEVSLAQLETMHRALNASQDGFAIWKTIANPDGTIRDFMLLVMNAAGAEAVGQPQRNLVGKTLREAVGAKRFEASRILFARALIEGQNLEEVVTTVSVAGVRRTFENTVVPFGVDLVLSTFRDVSEAEEEHSRLSWLAEHDYLTGVPNRAKLEVSLRDKVSESQENGTLMAFVFIDIDHFKTVNDSYGHDVGDALLTNFAKRIHHSLPQRAIVARIAGDEFAILLGNIKGEVQLQDLMQHVFDAMRRPFEHNGLEFSITCTAGCVLSDGSEYPDEIMRTADKAMYEAKHQGRNRFTIETSMKTT